MIIKFKILPNKINELYKDKLSLELKLHKRDIKYQKYSKRKELEIRKVEGKLMN
jgi:hypothetical protein